MFAAIAASSAGGRRRNLLGPLRASGARDLARVGGDQLLVGSCRSYRPQQLVDVRSLSGRLGVEFVVPRLNARRGELSQRQAPQRREDVPVEVAAVVGGRPRLQRLALGGLAAGEPLVGELFDGLPRDLADGSSLGRRRPRVEVDQLPFGGQPCHGVVLGHERRRRAVQDEIGACVGRLPALRGQLPETSEAPSLPLFVQHTCNITAPESLCLPTSDQVTGRVC